MKVKLLGCVVGIYTHNNSDLNDNLHKQIIDILIHIVNIFTQIPVHNRILFKACLPVEQTTSLLKQASSCSHIGVHVQVLC